jgi:hypothetical protein
MENMKEKRLKAGETFITSERGNSMTPLIHSGQKHRLAPITLDKVKVGDIVFCKVKGSYLTHLVKAVDPVRGCLIANNHGQVNGWTKKVFGKVIEVL